MVFIFLNGYVSTYRIYFASWPSELKIPTVCPVKKQFASSGCGRSWKPRTVIETWNVVIF